MALCLPAPNLRFIAPCVNWRHAGWRPGAGDARFSLSTAPPADGTLLAIVVVRTTRGTLIVAAEEPPYPGNDAGAGCRFNVLQGELTDFECLRAVLLVHSSLLIFVALSDRVSAPPMPLIMPMPARGRCHERNKAKKFGG